MGLAQITPRQMRYVCEAARLGSISAASESLCIAQSSILAAIDLAESQLKMRLFERKQSRGVRATPVGNRFVKAAQMVLSAQSDFVRAMGELGTSAPRTLRIGCFEPFGALFMAEFLSGLRSRPGEEEVVLMEGDQPQLRQWLAEGAIDAAVAYDIGPQMGEGISRICMVPPHVLLNGADPLATRNVVSIEELAKRPLVLLDLPETSTYLLTLFEAFAARPHVSFRTRSYETVRAAVSAGFGAAVLNMRPVSQATVDGKNLVRRPIEEALPAPVLIVADIYGSGKPPYLARVIEGLRDYFRSRPVSNFAVTTPSRAKQVFEV
jgi:DNA-binding transcriptional LysR family regulator